MTTTVDRRSGNGRRGVRRGRGDRGTIDGRKWAVPARTNRSGCSQLLGRYRVQGFYCSSADLETVGTPEG